MAATMTKQERNYLEEWAKSELERRERGEKKLAAVRKRIRDNREEAFRCLDAKYAAQKQAAKPMFDYEITCTVFDVSGGKRRPAQLNGRVTAWDENDAWARFCDEHQHWPSPHSCNRVIKKLS